uniref:Serine/threonine protein phosphatase 7 long form isogeny n=1 Tax=Cajanus cajan TaxID=3821 RepID=A0A151QZ19_CAJCA|nr:Serine/threonine protein phosphatase 7 long form isogeny [Cajanus cajan]
MKLENVALQLGLRVDGRAVTRPICLDWEKLCEGLIGVVPSIGMQKGSIIKLVWFREILNEELPNEPTQLQLQSYCRSYIIYLTGGVMLLNKSANRVHLMFLNLLIDFDTIRIVGVQHVWQHYIERCV